MSKETYPNDAPGAGDASNRYPFARFWRCALQVNPHRYREEYRGQPQGLDEDAYNQALLDKCRERDIKVVGIADHGSVESLDKLRRKLGDGGILVFPGFEIASTEKIHMVCLFDEGTTQDQLRDSLTLMELSEDGAGPSKHGCVALAKIIETRKGFWYAAHATGCSGLLRLNHDGGGLPHVWKDELVRAVQIPGPVADVPDNYRDIIENKNPDYKRTRPIIVINAKDVASPEDLDNPSACSWIKMTRPSFAAFKTAFRDPESRIRLALPDEPHSTIESVRIRGGYLDGVQARFSDCLNAVIGGRGTGKSTLIECVRYALELVPKGKQALKVHQDIVGENLGKEAGAIELTIRSAGQHGRRFTIFRRFGERAIVRDASGAVSTQTPRDLLPQIEVYGQNEIIELAKDGLSRARLLERFLPADEKEGERREILRKKLRDNAQKLIDARNELDEVTEKVARLPKLGEQLKGFRDLGIEVKLAKTPLYARERQLVERVEHEVEYLESRLAGLEEGLPDLTFLGDKALEGLPDAQPLEAMRVELEKLRDGAIRCVSQLRQTIGSGKVAIDSHRAAWLGALQTGEQELEKALAALPSFSGKSGREIGAAFQTLSQEIERTRPLESKKQILSQLVATLEQERLDLIAELSAIRKAHAGALQAAVKSLNRRLQGKLRVKLQVEGERRSLIAFLEDCGLEGVREKRLRWIEEAQVTPLALARAVREGAAKLAEEYGITPVVADALAKLPYSKLIELEAIELVDGVGIELNVARGDAEDYRELANLSTGQQCTAVLHLLLLDNPDPLVVDQPEDNLDNAFIAERIVRELRDAKLRRQFLFSTHNANIVVFGDAEWIGVLTAPDKRGALDPANQGSIDVPKIREQAAEILEGGRAAFSQRRGMYEF